MSKWLSIGEIVESVSITHKFDKPKLKFLNTADADKGKIVNYTELPISELKGQAKKTIQKDDILFSEVRPKNKHYAYVDIEDCSDYVVSTKLMVLRKFNDNVNNKYFYYSLINDKMLDILQSRAENRICSFPQITFDLLSEYKIRIPEISEQESIAHILEIIDKKIELNNKINSEFERIAKTLYDYWFVQFYFPDKNERPYKSSGGAMVYNEILKRDIPVGWEVKNISKYCNIIDCLHSKKPDFCYEANNLYLLQLENLTNDGYIDITNKYYISKDDYKSWTQKIEIQENDFVFTNAGRTGSFGKIPKYIKCALGRNLTAIRPISISPYYLRMFFGSNDMKQQILSNLDCGAFFKSFNVKSIKLIDLLIPQENILNNFISKISPIIRQIETNNIEIQFLTETREFLLPMLMNGQVSI